MWKTTGVVRRHDHPGPTRWRTIGPGHSPWNLDQAGDQLVLLQELSVGNDIHVQAIEIAEEGAMRATTIDVPTNP